MNVKTKTQESVATPGISPPSYTGRRRPSGRAMALVGTMLILMLILASALIGFAKLNGGSGGDLGSTTSNMMQMTKRRVEIMQAENLADAGLRAGVQWISELGGPPLNTTAFTPLSVTPAEFYAASGRWDSNKWTYVNFPDADDPSQGQFRVRFYPHTDNAAAAQRAYLVECIGVYKGTTRVVRADIRQKNFAQYAYFTDNASTAYWIAGQTTFNGPVHINNSNNQDINIVWDSYKYSLDQARIFQWDGDNAFTMWSNNGANNNKMKWQKDETSSTTTNPATDSQWGRIIKPEKEGTADQKARTGPEMLADKVEMPTTSTEQLDAALGGNSAPTSTGVYVPTAGGNTATSGEPTGGVYIRGQVDDMVLEASGLLKTDQKVYIYQGANFGLATTDAKYGLSTTKWVLTTSATGITTLQRFSRTNNDVTKPFKTTADSGYTRVYSGVPNGVIYSYNDIGYQGVTDSNGAFTKPRQGGLSGTVANSVTDATGLVTQANQLNIVTRATVKANGTLDTSNSSEVNIDGNILYAEVDKNASSVQTSLVRSGVLGVVSGQIRMVENASVVEDGTGGNPNITGFALRPTPEDGAYADGAIIDNLSVHATLMAYDAISVDNYGGRPKGEFRLLGGYIAKNGAKFGQLIGGSDQTIALNQKYGFRRILNYDKRVANTPPPYFPGTGQTYEVISYQRVLAPLQN